jgi:glycosyltransferase involved in cell wall biosynthesis
VGAGETKLLMVHDYPPLTGGGLALGALELARVLGPGVRCRIVSSRGADDFADDRAALAGVGTWCGVGSTRRALRALRAADVLVVHWTFSFRRLSTAALVLGPLLGTATVCVIHTAPAHCRYNRMRGVPDAARRPVVALLRAALRRCAHVVALGDAHAAALEGAGIRASDVLPLPVARPAPRPRSALRPPLTLGFAGELSRMKGADDLPALLRVLTPQLAFRVAGRGPLMRSIAGTIAALAPDQRAQVSLLGFVSPQDMPAFYAGLDILLVLSRTESQCRVALEAMAAGVVVLARCADEVAHVVQDGVTGFLIDPDDPPAIARLAADLAAAPDRVATVRARALAHAERAFERSSADWRRFLADVDAARRGRTAAP